MILKNTFKLLVLFTSLVVLAACGDSTTEDFDTSHPIHVISREPGAGTRDAFIEVVGLTDEDDNDLTDQSAIIQNSNNGVMQGVAQDLYGIGYISVGTLNDSIKPLSINGVLPETEAIQSGEYQVARNFNLVIGSQADLSEQAQDFWNFIFSEEGQQVVEDEGYVPVEPDAEPFEGGDVSGSISFVGSTTVTPVIEALSGAYNEINPDVTFDITSPGSGAGVTAAIEGTADIGMASRELDEDETEQVDIVESIAIDGIALIVNNGNPIEGLALEEVNSIFGGEITNWDEVIQ